MALTEEQRKRMEENRKRALDIRKKREMEKEEAVGGFFAETTPQEKGLEQKRRTVNGATESEEDKKPSSNVLSEDRKDCDDSEDESLEDFERDASAYISQTEAQRAYCLPKGTIDVLSYIERDNPHQRGWSKMKLYSRAEVRRRARKRYGGKTGLILEREKRKKKKYEKELKEVKEMR
ncbi:hypothetical protein ACHAXM_008829 [Skeletonema potamos]